MKQRVRILHLDLTGRHVATEAASGAYAVTPVLAALAGAASVTAVTATSRYGTIEEIGASTMNLAGLAGVADRIEVVGRLSPEHLQSADVVTNSGHVRPLDESLVNQLKPGAVIPLMYEAWELAARPSDVDVLAASARGIAVAGTNERQRDVDVFSYLGAMAVSGLHDSGVAVYGSRVAVLCDNDFASYIMSGLDGCGATTSHARSWDELETDDLDAVVYAMTPRYDLDDGAGVMPRLASRSAGAVLLQFWGDFDRDAAEAAGLVVRPVTKPAAGHMGVLPSVIGPEPIVRLQAGGLKVAQVLLKRPEDRTPSDVDFLDVL